MRPFIIITSLLAISAVAIPLAFGSECKQLHNRMSDEVVANGVKALIAFGAFLWGGGIIARRAVKYYFVKLEELEKEQLMAAARMRAKIRPQPLETTLIDMSGRM